MDDLQSSEASAFVVEGEVEPLVIRCIEAHLKDVSYEERMVTTWVNYICEDAIQALNELAKPFKYIVNVIIMQNTGAGMHAAISEYCDGVNDGVCVVKWPSEKNKDSGNCCCIVTVFGVAYFQ